MKKTIIILTVLALGVFASCDEKQKDPIKKTAAVELAGEWYVRYDGVDADGKVVAGLEDMNDGNTIALTFNVASDAKDSIWVSDTPEHNLLGFQVKVPCNLEKLTFGSDNEEVNIYGPSDYIGQMAIIKNGKILKGAAKTPSGMPADSIIFEVKFPEDAIAAYYSCDHYLASGFRYTGLAADE